MAPYMMIMLAVVWHQHNVVHVLLFMCSYVRVVHMSPLSMTNAKQNHVRKL